MYASTSSLLGMTSSVSGDAESFTYSLAKIITRQRLPWDLAAPRKMRGGKLLSLEQQTMLHGDLRILWLLNQTPTIQVLCLCAHCVINLCTIPVLDHGRVVQQPDRVHVAPSSCVLMAFVRLDADRSLAVAA